MRFIHSGRLVATQFLALPDKVRCILVLNIKEANIFYQRRLPDYYAKIAAPISIDQIEVSHPPFLCLSRNISISWSYHRRPPEHPCQIVELVGIDLDAY